ncbi:isopeptide-forming domain-containing fimbrial protein [Corynebacterium hylobatis]|uniref:Isopeptide-forming domain-containing fimbrial protein n=1 Tax=Corynebacterium hylobatis TaxID=1859290 RepID=A0A3S0HIG9_9CORY|nr:SpaH/EbpB family LPXTG-anchored major pilin [Corynebacterium hylobatis]RSZ64738.1 isopeptide-forming domain-containing fimbrial protein [Corynebacterium hylobatis]
MKKTHKRISAAVLSLALGFSVAGAPVLAPMAAAQISTNQASTVDLGADVSLTINKYEGLPVTDPADLDNLERLEGFNFLIEKVEGIDLSTTAGWQAVADLNAADTSGLILTEVDTVPTDTSGVATIDSDTPDFGVGVYLVTEQPMPGYTVAAPFFVTLPFTDTDTGVWNYDQVVHPKNQADINIEKDVEDLGATLGQEITYTISAPLPAGDLTALAVVDDLPDELTAATNVRIFTGTSEADRAAYTLDDGSIVEAGDDGNKLTVSFGANDRAALQALRGANPDLQIIVEFDTTVGSLPANDVIENHASIDFGGGLVYSTDDPDNPDDGTETRLGQLTINKVDVEEELITGGTAAFELWRCQADGDGFRVIGEPLSAATSATDVNSVTDTFVTTNGQATLYGVQVLDWVNGGTPTADIGEALCVVETVAPEGYTLNPEPQSVSYTEETDDDYAMVVNVINLDDTIDGQLPATGGMGTMAMIAGGLLVAVVGGFAALRGNRARG